MSLARHRHAIRINRFLNLGRVVFLEQSLSWDVLQPVRSHHILRFDKRVAMIPNEGRGKGWRGEP